MSPPRDRIREEYTPLQSPSNSIESPMTLNKGKKLHWSFASLAILYTNQLKKLNFKKIGNFLQKGTIVPPSPANLIFIHPWAISAPVFETEEDHSLASFFRLKSPIFAVSLLTTDWYHRGVYSSRIW